MTTLFWFARASLELDYGLFTVCKWHLFQKIEFLWKKYLEIIILLFRIKKFKFGESSVKLFGKKIFYDSPYGIAGYQSMLVRQQRMLRDAGPKSAKTIVDVGANVGFFSMMLREIYPEAQIYAVEPVPQIFANLKANLTSDQDSVYNLAISDINGAVKMSFKERESAISHVINSGEEDDSETVKVKSMTLDNWCHKEKIEIVDLLKIDTEGYEVHVLKGAKKTLAKTRYLHMEISLEDENYTFSEINSMLYSEEFNFQLVYFRNFTDKGYGPIPVGDFLFRNVMLD